MVHAPLNQAGIIVSPRAHYLEDPPRVIGFEGVLHTGASSHSHRKTRVPFAIRYSNDSVLIRGIGSHNAPIEPTGFTTSRASLDVTLSSGVVSLKVT